MASKEIILNNVNVNECEFYGYEGICKLYSGSNCSKDCSNYPNCNYKQLKHKEQELEELKQWQKDAENLFKTQTDNADKVINRYKQVFDDVENSLKTIIETNRVYPLQANLQKVLNIINRVKEQ